MACQSSVALGVLVLMSCISWSSAIGHIVGWDTGINYTTWVSGKSFKSQRHANYTAGAHTVDEVSYSDYSSCSTSNVLSTDSSGTTVINLTTAGTHYFICSIPAHCSSGMKLAVTVAGAASPIPTTTTTDTTNSCSMSIGSIRELAIIGLGGLVAFVLGVF